MIVGCWLSECEWCEDGWCRRNMITIGEDLECEDFKDYRDSYNDAYWKACCKDGKKFRRLEKRGKKIEYNGYVFYTDDKITADEEYVLTEERTGLSTWSFRKLKDMWDKFIENVGKYPDVSTFPEEEKRNENAELTKGGTEQ